jgi:K+-sensing histidine kinase KdpD
VAREIVERAGVNVNELVKKLSRAAAKSTTHYYTILPPTSPSSGGKGMSKWDTSLWWLPSAVLRYGLVVFCVVGALLVGELLHHLVDAPPWYEFLAAVMISTWVGGLGPGALAVLLSTVAVDYFFMPPLHTFSLDIAYLPRLGVFGLSALLISWLTTKRKRAETSLRQAHDELEAKVTERTAALQQTNEALQTEIAERKPTS